jgi:PPOX class probable F420-dependent enzyme
MVVGVSHGTSQAGHDQPMTTLEDRHQAVLVTLRKDGSPQTSNIAFTLKDGVARVSVTADRAKTRNLERDPRCLLHVLGSTFWEYAALPATATLGPVTTEPGDEAGRELLEVYEAITGKPHPDPDEFYAAMVSERRLVLRLTLQPGTGPLA